MTKVGPGGTAAADTMPQGLRDIHLFYLRYRLPPHLRNAASLLFCLILAGIPARPCEAQKAVTFPDTLSYSLDKAKINLPADFEGRTNLLLISFEPEQQKDVDSWFPVAQALLHTDFNFRWYRLPISARENFVFRWWENSSMRSDEEDPETWHWIIPLYVDKDAFRRALNIPNERNVVALLTDKQGRVLWQASGPLTPQKRVSLMAAVTGAAAPRAAGSSATN